MNDEMSQKEKLLMMMTEIYNQLEELESVLEESFSDLRESYFVSEETKLSAVDHRMTKLEEKIDEFQSPKTNNWDLSEPSKSSTLNLKLGF